MEHQWWDVLHLYDEEEDKRKLKPPPQRLERKNVRRPEEEMEQELKSLEKENGQEQFQEDGLTQSEQTPDGQESAEGGVDADGGGMNGGEGDGGGMGGE